MLEGDVGRNDGRGFLDDEAGCDDVGGEGDIDDDDLVDLIDDTMLDEEDADFYRALDNERGMDGGELEVPVAPRVDPDFADVVEKRGVIIPLRISDSIREERDESGELVEDRHVNLLLTERDGSTHYSTITGFSRLVCSQVSRHNGKQFYCYRCLHGFSRQDLLDEHKPLCSKTDAQRVKMPVGGTKLKFTNVHKQLRAPFVVYADFECLLKPYEVETSPVGVTEGARSQSIPYQEHIPCSYAYKVVSDVPEYQPPLKLKISENAASDFLNDLKEVADYIMTTHILHPKRKPRLQELTDEQRDYYQTGNCHICGEVIEGGDFNSRRVLDHDHFVSEVGCTFGKFRGPAHSICNLKLKVDPKTWKLPVVLHNLKNYDSHLIIKALEKEHGDIRVVPNNMEKFMSMDVGQLRFIDSFQFLATSLERLVDGLTTDDLHYTRAEFTDREQFKLVRQKGVFPYDYLVDMNCFDQNKLPNRPLFFNRLTNSRCSPRDYFRAVLVWNEFRCQTFADYHNVYLRSDVVLLADVFETFRASCMATFHLDAVHYMSLPGFCFDAALKFTKVELELMSDPNMYLFMENSIRGGISMISHRFAKANHTLLPDFKVDEKLQHLIYLDCNNLYGGSLSQYLPTGGFNWPDVEAYPIETIDEWLLPIPSDSPKGYIYEIDIDYPQHLHDEHNCYPLAPEKLVVRPDMLSPFVREKFPDFNDTVEKLVPNLMPKSRYTVHYQNLQLYVKLGLVVTKIHRVLEFDQAPWLKPYIDLNTEKRKNATSEFEKDFFKLCINSMFGKTMENVRQRIWVEMVMDDNVFRKRVAKPTFQRGQMIREDLFAVQQRVGTVHLNKPIYCGFTVLELSKRMMYDFHYNHMKVKYPGDRLKLLFTDTDSLSYAVETDNIYEDMAEDAHLYDFSAYPRDHPLYSATNKKVIGKFKDELGGAVMREFVGLRPKCYSISYDGKEKKTAAGVKKVIKERMLRHGDFVKVLETLKPLVVVQNNIVSRQHALQTVNQSRVGLSALDTKRWILPDGVSTLAYGHYSTL